MSRSEINGARETVFVRIAGDTGHGHSALAAAVIHAAIEDERASDEEATSWLETTGLRWLGYLRAIAGKG